MKVRRAVMKVRITVTKVRRAVTKVRRSVTKVRRAVIMSWRSEYFWDSVLCTVLYTVYTVQNRVA